VISLFIVGAPGAGKTTLARRVLQRGGDFVLHPRPKWSVGASCVAAGHYTDDVFSGGDTVPYSGARACLEFWASELVSTRELTIFDGSRFATRPSLAYVRERSRVVCVYVDATPDELAARRAARGSDQDPAWMRGAETRARNFADLVGATRVRVEDAYDRVVDVVLPSLMA